jgi:hypothetical protein
MLFTGSKWENYIEKDFLCRPCISSAITWPHSFVDITIFKESVLFNIRHKLSNIVSPNNPHYRRGDI